MTSPSRRVLVIGANGFLAGFILAALRDSGCTVVRGIRPAAAAAATGTPLPPAYFRIMRGWFWLGWPAFAGVLAIFWLMVAKPA